ncbi:leucine-rich repeat domain-containing protein [Cyanobacteria bacterium FACHB-471]|nr:leucine-rich repeat domain-containing protein [Cyanobacteria bacterium FACHB-471]
MSLSLLALKIIGPPVAKRLLELFNINSSLTNAVLEQAIDVGVDEVLSSSEARKTLSQQIDQVAKQLAADLQPLFEYEARDVEHNSRTAILLGVAETLIKARLSSDTLAELNFDAARLKQYLLQANPSTTRLFSQGETALYHQAIEVVSQRLIEAAPEVEGFELSSASVTLQRLSEIVRHIEDQREQATRAADNFAVRYRGIVQSELDRLEVFGLQRMDRLTSRQSLSTAYITLSVSGPRDEGEKTALTLMDDERSERDAGRRSRQVDEVLCECRRLVIRGGAGAGKSTLLQWLAVRAATQDFQGKLQHWNYKIPFFIRLRNLVDKAFPTPEKFPALTAPNCAALMPSPDWVHQYLDHGQALVLIDGVDELPRQERQDFLEALKDLVRDFSEAIYIVTSRPSGLKDAQGEVWQEWEDWVEAQDFVNLNMEPMSPTNIEEFVVRWHSALPADTSSSDQSINPTQMAGNLKSQLRQRSELRRLASTPLLCAMICALHRERRETLPSARLQLYRECIEMLLDRRDAGRGIPLDETYPIGLNELQKTDLLQSLALKLMRLNRSDLEADRVDDHFATELKNTSLPPSVTGKQIRELFVDRAGLLREPIVGQIDFAHRTFQEYLAAKAALDDDSLEELLQKVMDDQWRESIIVAAGLARPKERAKLLKFLLDQGDNQPDNKHYLHLLAVACLETTTSVDQEIRDRVLASVEKLLPPQDDDEIAMVSRAGNEIVPLLKYERHYSADEACNCIGALVQIGTPTAMQLLVDYAKATFESEDDQHSIGRAIGRGWDIFDQNTFLPNVLTHLKILDLGETQISDVSPLKNLTQLTRLDLDETLVTDVSHLSGLTQLKELYLFKDQVIDLSALSGLTQLTLLHLSETQVTDLSALSGLTQLKELYLSGTQVTDLSALSGLTQLTLLYLSETQVIDLSALSELTQLTRLDLSKTQITDLSVLSGLTQLALLDLSETQITDLSVLSGLTQLTLLYLSKTQVTDLSALSGLTQLARLYLSGTQVTDLSALSGLTQLARLDLSGTQVTDLSALSGLTQLEELDLSGTQVTDLSALSGLTQLILLNLSETQITDVSCLKHLHSLTILGRGRQTKQRGR